MIPISRGRLGARHKNLGPRDFWSSFRRAERSVCQYAELDRSPGQAVASTSNETSVRQDLS
eukprot:7295005-Pyramimonas_sp.AAC.1